MTKENAMQTERQYLVSLGLARDGRGRFSAEAKQALVKAKADGVAFAPTATQIAKETRVVKPKRVVRAVAAVERPDKDSYEVKQVRSWAERKGLVAKGMRGKLSHDVIRAYLADQDSPVIPVRNVVKQEKIRSESTAWTYALRRASDPKHVSEPLVAFTTCGTCDRGIAYCKGHGSDSLPDAPKYLGGGRVMLTRPVK
jgi:hypothetical protein